MNPVDVRYRPSYAGNILLIENIKLWLSMLKLFNWLTHLGLWLSKLL